ncbi:MAG: carbohydrate ABC transporter permease [Chloroflexi bacterium]|nr:carbohydrate ABC transporter permease [Chloroflexota bacterium]
MSLSLSRRLIGFVDAALRYGLILFVVFISLAPFAWVVLSSFKTNVEVLDSALSWPAHFSLAGYVNAVTRSRFLLFFFNSLFVSTLATVAAIAIFGMAAYVLARYEFPGRNAIYAVLISSMLISLIPMQQPITLIVRTLGLYDTLWGLILVYAVKGLPTAIFVMHSYFKSLPKELEEAAVLDGASFLQTYTRVMLPLTTPAIASSGVLIFLNSWNEFLFALLLTQSEETRTLSYALRFFVNTFSYDYPTLLAAVVLTLLPSIIIYVLLQEQIHKSLVGGAIKG